MVIFLSHYLDMIWIWHWLSTHMISHVAPDPEVLPRIPIEGPSPEVLRRGLPCGHKSRDVPASLGMWSRVLARGHESWHVATTSYKCDPDSLKGCHNFWHVSKGRSKSKSIENHIKSCKNNIKTYVSVFGFFVLAISCQLCFFSYRLCGLRAVSFSVAFVLAMRFFRS